MTETSSGVGGGWLLVLGLLGYVLGALPLMGVFNKAGQPGIAAFVPIWNSLVLLKVVGRPWWWLLLFLVPIVNLVIAIIVWNDLSKSFNHGVGFTIGLVLLPWVFLFVLWLGSDQYVGPQGARQALPA